jgi:hypothetical protein
MGNVMENYRCTIIRGGQALYVLRNSLTAGELVLVKERETSPLARGRFGVLLRRLREVPIKPDTGIKLLKRRK